MTEKRYIARRFPRFTSYSDLLNGQAEKGYHLITSVGHPGGSQMFIFEKCLASERLHYEYSVYFPRIYPDQTIGAERDAEYVTDEINSMVAKGWKLFGVFGPTAMVFERQREREVTDDG